MSSQTLIGKETFFAVWQLVVLSAVADEVSALRFPFDAQLHEFVRKHDSHLAELWRTVQECGCFEDRFIKEVACSSEWIGDETEPWYPDLDSLKMALALSPENSEFWGVHDFFQLSIDQDTIQRACTQLLARLVYALLAAHFSFCIKGNVDTADSERTTKAVKDVFLKLAPIVKSVHLPSGPLFNVAFSSWRATYDPAKLDSAAAAYRRFVEGWAQFVRTVEKG